MSRKRVRRKRPEESPLQKALTTYTDACEALAFGIEYGIEMELYNKCMTALGSSVRVEDAVTSKQFVKEFYDEYLRLRPK